MRRMKVLWLLSVVLFLVACSSAEREVHLSQKLPDNLKVVSPYGERNFMKSKLAVDFQGWESDAPQTLFLTDGQKTYLLAYVLPAALVREVWGDREDVMEKLRHFMPQDDGTAIVDERTTALTLVIISPPNFWLFTPRAIVYAAGHIVNHEKFELLAKMIKEAEVGELTSGRYTDIFSLAHMIGDEIRGVIMPPAMLEKSFGRVGEMQEEDIGCGDPRVVKIEDAQGTKIKLVVKHMVFYGGAVFGGIDPTKMNDIRDFFLLSAQKAKVDLSVGNILSFNFINPSVETVVDLKDYDRHAIRMDKGFELSASVITNPIKRIGLIANFGRIVKYATEIAVPSIAGCIPDGDAWGHVVVTAQNLFTSGDVNDIQSVVKSSWSEIVKALVSAFVNENSWIYRILGKIGFASCSYSPNFIISQIANLLAGFPIGLIYDAFTKYIPFGYELLTKPRTVIYGAQNGTPLTGEQIIVSVEPATQVNSPGMLKIETVGPECRGNCYIRLRCPIFGVYELKTYLGCGLNTVNFEVPYNFYGDECVLILAVSHEIKEGGFLGIGGKPATIEVTTSQYTIKVRNCPECFVDPTVNPLEEGGGGGCASSSPYNAYTILAIAIIFGIRIIRSFDAKRVR